MIFKMYLLLQPDFIILLHQKGDSDYFILYFIGLLTPSSTYYSYIKGYLLCVSNELGKVLN